jgi:hypothetical protein
MLKLRSEVIALQLRPRYGHQWGTEEEWPARVDFESGARADARVPFPAHGLAYTALCTHAVECDGGLSPPRRRARE